MPIPSLSINDELLKQVDKDRYNTPRSEWFREAARMRLEIERAAENAGVDTDDLDDDWWRDFLYDDTREHLRERRERAAADDREREELEAD